MSYTVEKVIHAGGTVWRKTSYDDGHVVEERADAVLTYPSPQDSYAIGSSVVIAMTLFDFDGEARNDNGTVHLRVAGAVVELSLVGGTFALTVQSDVYGDVDVAFINDFSIGVRMAPFTLRFV